MQMLTMWAAGVGDGNSRCKSGLSPLMQSATWAEYHERAKKSYNISSVAVFVEISTLYAKPVFGFYTTGLGSRVSSLLALRQPISMVQTRIQMHLFFLFQMSEMNRKFIQTQSKGNHLFPFLYCENTAIMNINSNSH